MSNKPKALVEIRATSVRLKFTFKGERYSKTIRTDGVVLRPTVPNVKLANRLAREITQKLDLDIFVMSEYFPEDVTASASGPLTLSQLLDTWISTLNLAPSTLTGYASVVTFWKEAPYTLRSAAAKLGDKPLVALTLTDLKTAIAMRSELSGKTINNYVSVLREALALAVADRYTQRNVAAELPKAKWQKKPVDPFTREEVEAILADMQKHYPEPVHNATEFWFFTGLRSSELVGLRWANVDLASSHVLIKEAIVKRVYKASTKTNVERQVMLNSRAAGAMQRQRKFTQMLGEHVFLDTLTAEPWQLEYAYLEKYWQPTLKRCGIRYRRPYTCRHSYATMMLMAGMTPPFCAKQLGHAVEVFLTTYAKWLDGSQNAIEMKRFETALGGDGQAKEAM